MNSRRMSGDEGGATICDRSRPRRAQPDHTLPLPRAREDGALRMAILVCDDPASGAGCPMIVLRRRASCGFVRRRRRGRGSRSGSRGQRAKPISTSDSPSPCRTIGDRARHHHQQQRRISRLHPSGPSASLLVGSTARSDHSALDDRREHRGGWRAGAWVDMRLVTVWVRAQRLSVGTAAAIPARVTGTTLRRRHRRRDRVDFIANRRRGFLGMKAFQSLMQVLDAEGAPSLREYAPGAAPRGSAANTRPVAAWAAAPPFRRQVPRPLGEILATTSGARGGVDTPPLRASARRTIILSRTRSRRLTLRATRTTDGRRALPGSDPRSPSSSRGLSGPNGAALRRWKRRWDRPLAGRKVAFTLSTRLHRTATARVMAISPPARSTLFPTRRNPRAGRLPYRDRRWRRSRGSAAAHRHLGRTAPCCRRRTRVFVRSP